MLRKFILAKTDSGFTPLMVAVQAGNLEAIKLLIQHQADVNAQNGYQGKIYKTRKNRR